MIYASALQLYTDFESFLYECVLCLKVFSMNKYGTRLTLSVEWVLHTLLQYMDACMVNYKLLISTPEKLEIKMGTSVPPPTFTMVLDCLDYHTQSEMKH